MDVILILILNMGSIFVCIVNINIKLFGRVVEFSMLVFIVFFGVGSFKEILFIL